MLVSIFYAFQLSICFGIITSYNKVKFILKPTSLKMNSLTMQTSAPYSFVNNDLRPYAMKLHTPQQMKPQAAESETKPAQAPATEWKPSRINYIQFLVDSLAVYETLEDISSKTPILSPFKSTGLERSAALKEDLKWLSNQYSIKIPPPGPHGPGYSAHLRELAKTSIPKYMCHYYNHMFAHTAGGRMIGKKMADTFLDGTTLKFYQWEDDVKELMKNTVQKFDDLAATWTDEEKKFCLEETPMSFRYSGALMVYFQPPSPALNNMIKYE